MGTHHQGTKEDVQALDTFIKLTRAANSVSARVGRGTSQGGLTESQFGTLEALYHLGPLCPGEIAEKILKTSGNMTTVIDNLVRDGLVRRERSSEDRRQIKIHLTEQGASLIAILFEQRKDAIVEDLAILTPQEQETLGRLCKMLGKQSRD